LFTGMLSGCARNPELMILVLNSYVFLFSFVIS
jgi:hypothetical protein